MLLDRLTAAQIRKLGKIHCRHGHTLLSHLHCAEDLFEKERIGFIDIEAEDLNADYGVLFTYCIKDGGSKKIYYDTINKNDIKKWGKEAREDKRLLKNLIKDMGNFDRLVGHYSCKYDLPFIRTRALMCGVKFPEHGIYIQSDTWMILRHKFKLSRNSLESGTRNILGKTRKNHLSLKLRNGCIRGEKWALDATLDHNKRDVRDTEDLFKAISLFSKTTKSLI